MKSKNSGQAAHDDFKIKMSLKPLSPKGDLSKRDDDPYAKFFKRKIKHPGKAPHASAALPFRPEPMAIDPKYGPGDKVV